MSSKEKEILKKFKDWNKPFEAFMEDIFEKLTAKKANAGVNVKKRKGLF